MLNPGSSVEQLEECSPSGVELDRNFERPEADGAIFCTPVQRHPLVLAASPQAIDKLASLVICDLTNIGIKLRGRDLPCAEQEVLITTGTYAVFANVCRSDNGECELRFIPPLDGEQLMQFEQEGKWATVMGIV